MMRIPSGVGPASAGVGALAVVAARRVAAARRAREERLAVRPHHHGLVSRTITLTSVDGTPLHAWWIPGRPGAPTVLVVHGWASHAGDLVPAAPALVASGMQVLLLDLRGHGRSPWEGRATPAVFAQDIEVALDWLVQQDGVGPIAVLGHSMGGSAAIRAAATHPEIKAVVAVAAVADPTLTAIGFWPASLNKLLLDRMARRMDADPTANFARNVIRDLDVPVLLIHGERDRVVPVAHARALAVARPDAELLLLPDAGHAEIDAFAHAFPRLVEFLRDSLVPAAG